MTVSDFDARIAKLQEKILKDVGEPVPDDVRLVADKSEGLFGSSAVRKPGRSRVRASGRAYKVKPKASSRLLGDFKVSAGSRDGEIYAVVTLGRGKEDPAKIRRVGSDLIVGFEDVESAKEAIVEIKNKSIAVHVWRESAVKRVMDSGGVRKALEFTRFGKRAK